MMTLLYKEIRLCAHPASVVFAFLGCLVLVPAYPYSVIFLFGCLAPTSPSSTRGKPTIPGSRPRCP